MALGRSKKATKPGSHGNQALVVTGHPQKPAIRCKQAFIASFCKLYFAFLLLKFKIFLCVRVV